MMWSVQRTEVARANLRKPLAVAAVGAGLFALLRFYDPHHEGSYGFCPFLAMTGRPCPGCGGLRAVNDLTRGDFVAAASSNILVVLLVAVLAVAWVVWFVRILRGASGPMIQLGHRTGIAVIALVIVFGVVRNTPFGAWLAP